MKKVFLVLSIITALVSCSKDEVTPDVDCSCNMITEIIVNPTSGRHTLKGHNICSKEFYSTVDYDKIYSVGDLNCNL